MTHAEPSPPKTNCQEVSKPLGATDPRDLTLPLYGATFGQAITRFFRSYARFSGRASRSEYWWVMLAQTAAAGLLVCGVALGTESSLERLGVTVLIGFLPSKPHGECFDRR
ncbi:Predicted membrane protein [Mycobacteroides abscessus subsp. massiliense]|nr:Predicted membrane protein [Mycobacteroides abscessus subsp. massiliense]